MGKIIIFDEKELTDYVTLHMAFVLLLFGLLLIMINPLHVDANQQMMGIITMVVGIMICIFSIAKIAKEKFK